MGINHITKETGKTTILEVVAYTEEEGLARLKNRLKNILVKQIGYYNNGCKGVRRIVEAFILYSFRKNIMLNSFLLIHKV